MIRIRLASPVADADTEARELKQRGVQFEEYDSGFDKVSGQVSIGADSEVSPGLCRHGRAGHAALANWARSAVCTANLRDWTRLPTGEALASS